MCSKNLLRNVLFFIAGFFAVSYLMFSFFSSKPPKKKKAPVQKTKIQVNITKDKSIENTQEPGYDYGDDGPFSGVNGGTEASGGVTGILKGYIDVYNPADNIMQPASGIDVMLIGAGGVFITSTDSYGNYEVSVPAGDYSLVIDLPGIKRYERTVSVKPNNVEAASSISLRAE